MAKSIEDYKKDAKLAYQMWNNKHIRYTVLDIANAYNKTETVSRNEKKGRINPRKNIDNSLSKLRRQVDSDPLNEMTIRRYIQSLERVGGINTKTPVSPDYNCFTLIWHFENGGDKEKKYAAMYLDNCIHAVPFLIKALMSENYPKIKSSIFLSLASLIGPDSIPYIIEVYPKLNAFSKIWTMRTISEIIEKYPETADDELIDFILDARRYIDEIYNEQQIICEIISALGKTKTGRTDVIEYLFSETNSGMGIGQAADFALRDLGIIDF
jgi:hypothetical protein